MVKIKLKNPGFTLIELLVVISIISVLASILFPVFSRAREKARQATCISNQRQLAATCMMYAQDHEECLPDTAQVWQQLNIGEPGILRCPTKGKATANAYVFNGNAAGRSLGEFEEPDKDVLTCDGQHAATATTSEGVLYDGYDIERRHSGYAVCSFLDGHVGTDKEITGFEYRNDFEQPVGGEWVLPRQEVTLNGNRRFLGQYTNDNVLLILPSLPRHSKVTLEVDVYALRSWDGNGGPGHPWPDIWSISDAGVGTIYQTTFSHWPGYNYPQAFPDEYPAGNHPMRTGAIENNTLGYYFNVPMDAVYHILITFKHSASTLQLTFQGVALESIANESWGIDNIVITGE